MSPSLIAALGVHAAGGGRNLVASGQVLSPLTLARAQVSTRATAANAGGTWSEFLADAPRFHGAGPRLLAEGQRSNGVRNPRGEGAAAGANATNWSHTASLNGITATVIGAASHAGMGGVEIEFTGTATAGANLFVNFETSTGVAAAPGQVWCGSVWHRVSSGSYNGGAPILRIVERDSAGAGLANHNTSVAAPGAALQRAVGVSGSFGASAGRVSHALGLVFGTGVTANCRVQLLWPQLELATFASTPVLPPAGTLAASTRGADIVAAGLAALGVAASGACTLLWSGMLPQAAGGAAAQNLLELSDGTLNNRVLALNPAGGSLVRLQRVAAGAAASQDAGSMTAGSPFRIGLALDGAGRAALSLNGSAAVAVTGAPASGLTTLRLGDNAAGTAPMFGETLLLRLLPETLSDTALATAVAGLPV